MKRFLLVLSAALSFCLLHSSCGVLLTEVPEPNIINSQRPSVIRVNVTRQGYNFHRPWQQLTPSTLTGIGVVIKGPRVLVTSEYIANHRYIELEKTDTGEKSKAELDVLDYEANLALLKPVDPQFLANMQPLDLTTDAVQGDQLAVWQVKPNGIITPAFGTITSIELAPYPYGNHFLSYRLNSSLQYRFGNFTLPVIKDGKLAGLLMRHNANVQTIDIVGAPIIEHFLQDADDGEYLGFPASGIQIVSTEDPQLRRYTGISNKTGGIYVEKVIKDSPDEKAGIRQGDILFEISGFALDSRGNYDHPVYGKIGFSHLIRCEFHVGDTVSYSVFREGRDFVVDVIPDHRPPEAYLVPPYVIDTAPRYYILGGLVLQELSTSYLKEYGKSWRTRAPIHLVYLEANQHSLEKGGREKIVILSGILLTSYTVGYNGLSNLVVKRINNQAVGKLEDVPRALERPVNGFHQIEFEQRPKVIFLDAKELPQMNMQIQERYNLPALYNLESRNMENGDNHSPSDK